MKCGSVSFPICLKTISIVRTEPKGPPALQPPADQWAAGPSSATCPAVQSFTWDLRFTGTCSIHASQRLALEFWPLPCSSDLGPCTQEMLTHLPQEQAWPPRCFQSLLRPIPGGSLATGFSPAPSVLHPRTSPVSVCPSHPDLVRLSPE